MDRDIRKPPVLGIVVPCYNEELVLPETIRQLESQLNTLSGENRIGEKSFICLVDDGSADKTWEIIRTAQNTSTAVHGVRLSRNFGHQNALIAGLFESIEYSDCVISIDADLQQDPEAIRLFLEKYAGGAEIVYGVRNDRQTDSAFKRNTAEFFYSLMKMMGVDVKRNHADYRLMSRQAVEALKRYTEGNLFLRGVVPKLGFSDAVVHFEVRDRAAGESKYPLRKMIGFALNGITAFSITPLRMVTALGFLFTLISIFMAAYILLTKLFSDSAVPGWASIIMPIYLLGGIQLLSIGVIGEYVGRVYMESKGRPRYIVEDSSFD